MCADAVKDIESNCSVVDSGDTIFACERHVIKKFVDMVMTALYFLVLKLDCLVQQSPEDLNMRLLIVKLLLYIVW